MELHTRTAMITPTKHGVDYDWSDIELYDDTIDSLIGQAEDCEYICDGVEDVSSHMSFTKLADSFECVCKLSEEAAMAIFGIRDAVLKCCPNKRVTHLASRAKKSRTRKKNLRRAIKILEKMENKDAL